jgi:hypothetical protein
MFRSNFFKVLLGMLTAVVMVFLIYQIPAVHQRLSWRIDFAMTYLRGVVQPVEKMPTPIAADLTEEPTATEAPTATPLPTADPRTPTPSPTPAPTAIPSSASLQPPTYEKQTMNNCGPDTLSAMLRFYGWDGNQDDIDAVVKPKPEDRNVNVEELVYFTRNHVGWLSIEYRVGGTIDTLKKFIAAGIPMMIEETFHSDETYWPNDDLWAGHYLMLTGYDDSAQSFTTQDTYYGPDRLVTYTDLEKNWQSFNHVFIIIYRPEQEPDVKSILGADWDADVNRQNALDAAKTATQKDPANAFNWFNLGSNYVYFEKYTDAAQAYDQARKIGLPQRMLRYQFGPFIAYFNTRRTDDLIAIAKYALERTPTSEEAHLWFGWGLLRSGDTANAIQEFRKAVSYNSTYQDAQYALNYVGATP